MDTENDVQTSKWKSLFWEYFPYVLVIIGIILFKSFVMAPIKVNGDSMLTSLYSGDVMILNRIEYRFSDIERFDIVVVDADEEYIIKRVIGLPGERVEYLENTLYIDGEVVEDVYGSQPTEDFAVDVPLDSYFVLGDNRTNSIDSRIFGAFPKKKILGKTNFIIFPFDRMGSLE